MSFEPMWYKISNSEIGEAVHMLAEQSRGDFFCGEGKQRKKIKKRERMTSPNMSEYLWVTFFTEMAN